MGLSDVSIVIPTLGDAALLERCLSSLRAALAGPPAVEIVVAQSGPLPPFDIVRGSGGPAVRVNYTSQPLDFAANCNRALSQTAPLVLFLNDDVAVTPGFLEPLVAAFDDDGVFAATPRILRDDGAGGIPLDETEHRTFFSAGLFYHARLEPPRIAGAVPARPVSFGCGAALLVRRDRFEALGGFDPLYAPFYWEDCDLAYRAWKRGWASVCHDASTVFHAHRGTIGRHYAPGEIDVIHERNRFLFTWRNLTDTSLRAVARGALPFKLAEALLFGRTAPIAGYARARRLAHAVRTRQQAERAEVTRSDRAVLRDFRRFARAGR